MYPDIGFKFGTTTSCDTILDVSNKSSISREQFAVRICWDKGTISIKNLSQYRTKLSSGRLGRIKLSTSRTIEVGDPITVNFQHFTLTIFIPDYGGFYAQFLDNWAKYLRRFASPSLNLQGLQMHTSSLLSSTSRRSASSIQVLTLLVSSDQSASGIQQLL